MRDSIVTTLYNRPHLALMKTLEGLAKNDLRDTEIIVVDDGSTADYSGVWELFSALPLRVVRIDTVKDCPGTYHLNGFNGAAHAFNCGYKESVGDNVFILSSDTIIPPHAMTSARKRMLKRVLYHAAVVDMDTATQYAGEQRFCPFGWFMGTARENFEGIKDAAGNVWDEEYLKGFAFDDNDYTARLGMKAGRVIIDLAVTCWHQSHPPTSYSDDMLGWKTNEAYTLKKWGGIPWSHQDWHTGHPDPLTPKVMTKTQDSIHCDLSQVKVHAAV